MKKRYDVSQAFAEECKSNFATNRQGKIHIIEDNIDIVGENYEGKLVDFTIEDNCYVNDTFIGTTVAKKITVNILNDDSLINMEEKEIQAFVGINNEYIPFGNFIIEKPTNEEVKEKTNFIGYDYMIKFNVPYNNRISFPVKAVVLLKDICNQVGVEVGNTEFINSDYLILGNPFTNNEDCRTVLSNIAQLAGGFAKIGRDNKLYIKTLSNQDQVVDTIDGNNYFDNFSKNNQWGEINSLVLKTDNIEGENTTIQDEESIAINGLTEIVISGNYFLIDADEREKVINNIWSNLKGVKYTPFKTQYYGFPYFDAGDKITIKDNEDNEFNSYILNHSITYNGGFSGDIETIALTKTQTAYKNFKNIKTQFKNVELKVDKNNDEICSVIEQQTETNSQISKVVQSVDELNSKISDIADITVSKESSSGELTFESINQSEPIRIEIHPILKSISYLYPTNSLFPSNDLYISSRVISFLNTKTNEEFFYELPTDLLYYDEETFDSFILDYENQTCIVEKKLEYDENGNIYKLLTPKTLTFDYPTIQLTSGDYTISIVGYNNAYIFVRLMSENIYTTQFATKVEVNSKITEKAYEIESEVSKKVGENEIISKINQSAEQIGIKAEKIKLEGYTTINNGFAIDENGNASIANETVKINENGILLKDGAEIIGGNGVLTNLQFNGSTVHAKTMSSSQAGNFDTLGFENDEIGTGENIATKMVIFPKIPVNFIIISAKITLRHFPLKLYANNGNFGWGYARKLKLYEGSSNIYGDYDIYEGVYVDESSDSEIYDAFGSNGFTPSIPSNVSQKIDSATSIDISDYITDTGYLIIKSADTTPTYTGDTETDFKNCAYKTGMVSATLDILGYLKR